jgi:hypothetical protein
LERAEQQLRERERAQLKSEELPDRMKQDEFSSKKRKAETGLAFSASDSSVNSVQDSGDRTEEIKTIASGGGKSQRPRKKPKS